MSNIKNRGFASMNPEKRKEFARLGGLTAHKKGVAYKFTHEVAVKAGKKGKKKPATITL